MNVKIDLIDLIYVYEFFFFVLLLFEFNQQEHFSLSIKRTLTNSHLFSFVNFFAYFEHHQQLEKKKRGYIMNDDEIICWCTSWNESYVWTGVKNIFTEIPSHSNTKQTIRGRGCALRLSHILTQNLEAGSGTSVSSRTRGEGLCPTR